MKRINISVADKLPKITAMSGTAVTDNTYLFVFDFDDEWQNGVKTVYVVNNFGKFVPYIMDGNSVEIQLTDARYVDIGISQGTLVTSLPCRIVVNPSIKRIAGEEIPPPAPDVYDQIIDLLNKLGETGASPEQIQAVLEQYIADGNLTPNKIGAVAQNQGEENADKILGIDAAGEVVPVDKPSGGTENAVTYTEQELTAEEQAQARENIGAGQKPLIVKFTGSGTDDNPYTCDKTFEEIATAYNAGRDIKMHYNVVAAAFGYNDTVAYSGVAEPDLINTGMQLAIFRDESSINFENVELVINEQKGICVVSVIVPVAGYNLGVIKADPAESTDTVPARIGDDRKLYVDALPSSTLQSAINTALAQAKESGEFDGEDGASVTITNTTESTEDGGENVVEFSDGNKLTVWNGKTGTQGDPGVYVGSEDTMPEGTIVRIDPDGEAMELVEVDDTLKLQGYAADAKVTGEKLDELSEAIADKVTGAGIKSIVALTQAEFDAIAEKDAATLYIVTDASTSDDGTVEPGNPSDMIPVLRSDGTAYINLGIEPIDGAKYEVCFRGVNDLSTKGVFGNRYTKVSGAGGSEIEKAWVCGYYNNSAYASFGGGTIDLTTKHIFTLTNTAIILDNDIVTEITEGTGAKDSVMLLFSSNNADTEGGLYGTTPCAIDLFYLRIWDGEDNLLHEYLPATDTEGVACIYDSVAKEYLYNAAESGAFEYREELEES